MLELQPLRLRPSVGRATLLGLLEDAMSADVTPSFTRTIPIDEAGPCDECFDWYRNPLNPNMVTVDNPTCPALRGHLRCVRFPLTESPK